MSSSVKKIIKKSVALFKTEKKIAVPVSVGDSRKLEGKVALITGGNSGIGFAIAKEFVKNGASVILVGTNTEKLNACKESIGEKCRCIRIDLSETSELYRKVNEAAELFNGRIDILVNSAGVIDHSAFFDVTPDIYDRVMNINAKGSFFMSQAVGKHMIEKNIHGHILNISSSSALRPANTPYNMSKWAVNGLTKGLADTLLPYGIIVNAIAPGPTATPMFGKSNEDNIHHSTNPSGRFALPGEIAALAAFMVSDFGNMIVGDTFYITGGSGTISYHK